MTPETSEASKFSIIVSKGSLDMAYPAFILGNAAATMGYEVHLFFTFWGTEIIHKKHYGDLHVTPVGNPAAHFPQAAAPAPGVSALMTSMMKKRIASLKIDTIPDMIATAKDLGVHLHACSTSMEMMDMSEGDLIDEVEDVVGAASFLQIQEGGQTIFI